MFKNRNENNVLYKCTVRLLDDSDVLECQFQPCHKGFYLIECLCEQLEIKEKDYFGLRYVDTSKQRHWLDISKSIIKQCKDVEPILFSFRVKYYPADPFRLTGNGRIMLYQQLKRDLRHGRLYCSMGEAAALGALIVQEELGDYDKDIHIGDYVASMHLALRQTDSLEKKIMELHEKREPGQGATTSMDEFMSIARDLETYGIDPHSVKDHRGTQLYIGINYSGISTFLSGKRSQHFRWNEVHKLNFEGKMFIIHLSYTDASREPKRHTLGFKCISGPACRYLWRCAIEQMLFFTLPNAQHAAVVSGGGFFSWGSKFKYTGRTEREILTESISLLREQKLTNSTMANRKASSVPATPSSPQGHLAQIRYSSLPRSTMSEPMGSSAMPNSNTIPGCMGYGPHLHDTAVVSGMQMPSLEPVSEEARLRAAHINSYGNNVGDMPHYYLTDNLLEYPQIGDGAYIHGADGSSHPMEHTPNSKQQQLYYTTKPPYVGEARGLTRNGMAVSGREQHSNNTGRGVRKFHLWKAFIPSFLFVVVGMVASAIFILETETEFFQQIRTMPEMISLRYQYYQPLKQFMLRNLWQKV